MIDHFGNISPGGNLLCDRPHKITFSFSKLSMHFWESHLDIFNLQGWYERKIHKLDKKIIIMISCIMIQSYSCIISSDVFHKVPSV